MPIIELPAWPILTSNRQSKGYPYPYPILTLGYSYNSYNYSLDYPRRIPRSPYRKDRATPPPTVVTAGQDPSAN